MPQTSYIVIKPDAHALRECPREDIDLAPVPRFAILSRLIVPLLSRHNREEHQSKPTYLERIRVWHDQRYLDMFVDEEGIRKGLTVNPLATEIYHANMLVHEHGDPKDPARIMQITADWPRIHGVAVLFNRRVWF